MTCLTFRTTYSESKSCFHASIVMKERHHLPCTVIMKPFCFRQLLSQPPLLLPKLQSASLNSGWFRLVNAPWFEFSSVPGCLHSEVLSRLWLDFKSMYCSSLDLLAVCLASKTVCNGAQSMILSNLLSRTAFVKYHAIDCKYLMISLHSVSQFIGLFRCAFFLLLCAHLLVLCIGHFGTATSKTSHFYRTRSG